MRLRTATVLILALAASCGGGGSGDGGGGPPPPPVMFAKTTNTALAIAAGFRDAAVIGPFALVSVSESEARIDFNSDGDMVDAVMHVVNTQSGVAVSLGLAVVGSALASDKHFAFLVSEPGQGVDLNADGDATDSVWHVYDPVAATPPKNLQLATLSTGLAGAGTKGGFVLLQSEPASGTDLDADGDAADVIVRAFDGNTFATAIGVFGVHAPGTPLVARNGRVLFARSEAAAGPMGTDLNNDMDANDVVLAAIDFNPGIPAFTNLMRAVAGHPYVLTDVAGAYFVDEATQGATDRNNDGDTLDAILTVFNFGGGLGEAMPMTPAIPAFAVAANPNLGIAAGPTRIIVGITEPGNGNRDLNTDGDALDDVVGWVDTGAATFVHLHPFPLGLKAPVIAGVRGLVPVNERAIGFTGQDLNGDGDTNDDVVHILDTTSAPGALTSTGFAVNGMAQAGDDAILGIAEAADRGIDRNGDGDTNDTVLRYLDLATGASRNLAVVSASFTFYRHPGGHVRLACFVAEGQSPTYGDLNADGDANDVVLELFTIDRSGPSPTLVAPTPYFAGTAALATANAAPLRAGDDVILFPTFEPMTQSDLSGDSDITDTVLQYVTYLPPSP